MGPKYRKQPRSIGRKGKTDGTGDALIPRDQADACLKQLCTSAEWERAVESAGSRYQKKRKHV